MGLAGSAYVVGALCKECKLCQAPERYHSVISNRLLPPGQRTEPHKPTQQALASANPIWDDTLRVYDTDNQARQCIAA